MGYNTVFEGELLFTKELTASQLAYLNTILGQFSGDHPDWMEGTDDEPICIDLMLMRDHSGLRWDGSEKSYYMVRGINLVLRVMKKTWPDFGLYGELRSQGEDLSDRWFIYFNEAGMAVEQPVVFRGQKVKCPSCDEEFLIEKEE